MAETFALKRLVQFLQKTISQAEPGILRLPVEAMRFLRKVVNELKRYQSSGSADRDFQYWDKVSSACEAYPRVYGWGWTEQRQSWRFPGMEGILAPSRPKSRQGLHVLWS